MGKSCNVGERNHFWKGGVHLMERICLTCGKEFFAIGAMVNSDKYSHKGLYCSHECFAKSQIKPKITLSCRNCGKMFEVIPAKNKAKYCSRECKHIAQHSKVEKRCLVCGNSYTVIKARENISKYCSRQCADAGLKKELYSKCLHCGKDIKVESVYEQKIRKYCSHQCLADSRKVTEEHKKIKNKQHDHIKRARKNNAEGFFTPEEWLLLKRQYHHKCPSCGRTEPEIKLTADHIIPLTKGGTNWIWNIQPLCKSCNSSKHNKTIRFSKFNIGQIEMI